MFHILKSILRHSIILTQYFFQPDDDAVEFNERYLNGELQVMFDDLNSDISYAEILKLAGNSQLVSLVGLILY